MRLRAVLLILIASIALLAVAVGGLFLLLDPERIRSTAEASLGRALGQEVRLEGPIARRFLPTPEVVIMSPKVLARSDGRILAKADRIDLQLAPAGLVSGQEPVGSMTVVRPALIAPLTSNDLLSLARGSGVGLISVTDGEVELRLAPGALPLRLSSMKPGTQPGPRRTYQSRGRRHRRGEAFAPSRQASGTRWRRRRAWPDRP